MLTSIIAGGLDTTSKSRPEALSKWIAHHVDPMHAGEYWEIAGFAKLGLPTYFSTQALMMVITSFIIILLFGILYKKDQKVPTGLTNFLESFIMYVRNEIAIKNLGEEEGRKWTPFFCTLFFFVLGCNLLGLIPGNATATGTFFVTGALASVTFVCMTIGTIIKFGPVKFLKAFAPPGVPGWVLILLWPLEVLGLFVKCISLTIRLFANMMAGHIVLFSIIGLMYVFGALAAPAFIVAVGIYALEVFVAFLQAYLFAFLSALFIGEVFHHAHGHDHEHAH